MMRANKHIYCGNNLRDLGLKTNGGDREIGNHKDCFRKGYALGINQEIKDLNLFLRKWGTAYKPYIIQHLSYNADKIPPGYQRATLAQALQRGFAFGSLARAKKEKARDKVSSRGGNTPPDRGGERLRSGGARLPARLSIMTHEP